jgi:flagellar biosynthesis/type III secretory pathway M-ring protein FliF/YscJ
MTVRRLLYVIVGVVIVALIIALLCYVKQAKISEKNARLEAESLRARVEALECENVEIREIVARANDAVLRATKAVEEAAGEHVERIEKIDSVDPDWLMCPLPDGVRDAFGNGEN